MPGGRPGCPSETCSAGAAYQELQTFAGGVESHERGHEDVFECQQCGTQSTRRGEVV